MTLEEPVPRAGLERGSPQARRGVGVSGEKGRTEPPRFSANLIRTLMFPFLWENTSTLVSLYCLERFHYILKNVLTAATSIARLAVKV